MSKELIIVSGEEKGLVPAYPVFDLTRNKVKVFKGVEFDIDNFIVLCMLENHEPRMVQYVTIHGQDVHIHYFDGWLRVVGLEERKVLWEKYTEFLIEVRRRLYPQKELGE